MMTSFIRFIFAVLIIGFVVNITIVLLANAQSQRRQARDTQQEQNNLKELIDDVGGRLRRMDMVVESQRFGSGSQVLETTLLLRPYASTGTDHPKHVVRIVIPRDRLTIEGVVLHFDPTFAEDVPDFRILRGATLSYFTLVYGEGQTAPLPPDKSADERFTFMPRDPVPELTRLHPDDDRPAYYEMRLWQYIWDLYKDPRRNTGPSAKSTANRGLTIIHSQPVTQTISRGHIYSADITTNPTTLEGVITIDEDPSNVIPGLQGIMEREAAKSKDNHN